MKKIIALGGGEITQKETLAIDKQTIKLTGKKHPKLLFVPTASSEAPGYVKNVEDYFGKTLGCKIDVLYILNRKTSKQALKKQILSADIIYVGGGNTLKMMNAWRRTGVDKLIIQAWKNGTVLTGLSAGTICWFEKGHSDSRSYKNPKKWSYIQVSGLGLIKGLHCPHYDGHTLGKPRREHFSEMIQARGGLGVAIDECAALEIHDNTFRVITSKPNRFVYFVYRKNGQVIHKKFAPTKEFRPISELYSK